MPKQETNMVSNEKQSNIFTETFNKLFKENKESSMFDRFSSLDAKEKILAVSTVGVIFGVLLLFVLVALPVAATGATGAAVALTLFFAVKAVEYGYKGLKWSAEKTWEGAKYTARKSKAGYEHSVDSLKRGAHCVKERTKEKASDVLEAAAGRLYRAAGNENYLDRINDELVPNSPQKEKFQEIREDLKAIFASGEDNSKLVKSILSGISSKIEEKIKVREEKEFTGSISMDDFVENAGLTLRWEKQKRFIDDLSVGKLQSLVTQRSLPKDSYFIRSIFSEHHSEIKEVIKEYKENHLYSSVSNMFNTAEKKANRPSLKGLIRSLPSFPSLGRKSPTKSEGGETKEPFSSDLGVLDNIATVDPTHFRRNSSSSSLYDGPPVLTPAAPPKAPKSPTSSRDSGRGSSPSTPERQSLPVKTLIEYFNTSPLTGRVQHTK